jgi:hypothetical protein
MRFFALRSRAPAWERNGRREAPLRQVGRDGMQPLLIDYVSLREAPLRMTITVAAANYGGALVNHASQQGFAQRSGYRLLAGESLRRIAFSGRNRFAQWSRKIVFHPIQNPVHKASGIRAAKCLRELDRFID